MVRGPRRDRDCRGCLRSGRCEYRVRFAQHDDVRLAFCGQQLLRRDHESWPSWRQNAAPARAVTGSPFSVAMSLAKLPSALGGRRVQLGSQIPESESQTHASRANHSCEVPHDGPNERLKKTGMERNLTCSMYTPVVTGFPVLGHRIMSSPIAHSTKSYARHEIYDVDESSLKRDAAWPRRSDLRLRTRQRKRVDRVRATCYRSSSFG